MILLANLTAELQTAWCAETSYADDEWSAENPAQAQCVVSSLVVRDYLGGDLIRFAVTGEGINENHYCNILSDGTIVDTTRAQYSVITTMTEFPKDLGSFSSLGALMLDDEETRSKYELLLSRVKTRLAHE